MVEFYLALEDFDRALELSGGRLASALYNRATITYRMGSYAEAEADFQAAVELEPSNAEFLAGLAGCRLCL